MPLFWGAILSMLVKAGGAASKVGAAATKLGGAAIKGAAQGGMGGAIKGVGTTVGGKAGAAIGKAGTALQAAQSLGGGGGAVASDSVPSQGVPFGVSAPNAPLSPSVQSRGPVPLSPEIAARLNLESTAPNLDVASVSSDSPSPYLAHGQEERPEEFGLTLEELKRRSFAKRLGGF